MFLGHYVWYPTMRTVVHVQGMFMNVPLDINSSQEGDPTQISQSEFHLTEIIPQFLPLTECFTVQGNSTCGKMELKVKYFF